MVTVSRTKPEQSTDKRTTFLFLRKECHPLFIHCFLHLSSTSKKSQKPKTPADSGHRPIGRGFLLYKDAQSSFLISFATEESSSSSGIRPSFSAALTALEEILLSISGAAHRKVSRSGFRAVL